MSFANLSIVGRLVRQPELMHFNTGREKTTFTVAINHPGRKTEQGRLQGTVDYIKVEAWGKLAQIAHKYLVKGSQVAVCGPFEMENWVDRNGIKRMTPLVEAVQIALPPRLTVADQPAAPGNSITGEMVFSGDPDDHTDPEEAAAAEETEEFVGEFKTITESDDEILDSQPTIASLTG